MASPAEKRQEVLLGPRHQHESKSIWCHSRLYAAEYAVGPAFRKWTLNISSPEFAGEIMNLSTPKIICPASDSRRRHLALCLSVYPRLSIRRAVKSSLCWEPHRPSGPQHNAYWVPDELYVLWGPALIPPPTRHSLPGKICRS